MKKIWITLPVQPADSIWFDSKGFEAPRDKSWEGCSRECGLRCHKDHERMQSFQPKKWSMVDARIAQKYFEVKWYIWKTSSIFFEEICIPNKMFSVPNIN